MRESATHIVVAWAVPKNKKAVDPMRPTCGQFSYEGQGIQEATSMMVKDEHNVITYDCAAACHGLDFGDARTHALPGAPRALFDDSKVVGQEGRHRPWMQRYDLADRSKEYDGRSGEASLGVGGGCVVLSGGLCGHL